MVEAPLEALKAVLSRLGWEAASEGPIGELWSDDRGHHIGLPFNMKPTDREWQGALKRVSEVTREDLGTIRQRVEWFNYDVSSFKVDGPTLDHTVTVNAGYNLFKTARQALRASATTARRRKPVIRGNYSAAGDRILDRSRFGQTEEGSYLVPLLVPVSDVETRHVEQPEIAGSTVIFEEAKIEPEERRATRTLADSLSAISAHLIEPARMPRQAQVDDLVQVGVSKELLTTLTDVIAPDGIKDFAVSFSWSESLDLDPPATDPTIVVPSESSDILKEATELISKTEEPKTETFSGPIVELRHDHETRMGHIVIDGVRSGRRTEIQVPLRDERLETAHRWFESRHTILVAGVVKRVSGRWQVSEPERLYSFSDPALPGM